MAGRLSITAGIVSRGSVMTSIINLRGIRSATRTYASVADQRLSAGPATRASAFSAAADVALMLSCSLSSAIVGDNMPRGPSGIEPGGNSSTYSVRGPSFLRNWGGSPPAAAGR